MTPAEAKLHHAANVLVAGTGLCYAWMLYLAEPDDPFALVNHPWQPGLRAAHILTAPLVILALGMIWRLHVWARLRAGFRPRRRTGWILALTGGPMILSGYALQVSSGEVARRVWLAAHLATSGLWIAGYLVHQLTPRRAAESADSVGRAAPPGR